MSPKIREIVGGILAIALLVIYAIALWKMVSEVRHWTSDLPSITFNPDRIWLINIIGGVVSAVIIASLGISKPGGAPTGSVQQLSKEYGQRLLAGITIAYVVVWVLLGGYSAYIGVFEHPETSSTLNEIGKAWIGLAIGALYAYLGINKKSA